MRKENEKVHCDEKEHTVKIKGERGVSEREHTRKMKRKVTEYMERKRNTQGKRRKESE